MTEQTNTLMNQNPKNTSDMVTPASDLSSKHTSHKLSPNKLLDSKNLAREMTAKEKNNDDADATPHPIFIEVSQRCLVTANQLKRYSKPSLLPADTRSAQI